MISLWTSAVPAAWACDCSLINSLSNMNASVIDSTHTHTHTHTHTLLFYIRIWCFDIVPSSFFTLPPSRLPCRYKLSSPPIDPRRLNGSRSLALEDVFSSHLSSFLSVSRLTSPFICRGVLLRPDRWIRATRRRWLENIQSSYWSAALNKRSQRQRRPAACWAFFLTILGLRQDRQRGWREEG